MFGHDQDLGPPHGLVLESPKRAIGVFKPIDLDLRADRSDGGEAEKFGHRRGRLP